jgi:hypothetical protein
MSNGININVGGGAVSIGTVNQGDNGHVLGKASLSQGFIQQEAQRAESTLALLSKEYRCSPEEFQAVMTHLNSLAAESKVADKDSKKGAQVLKLVRENFSWAYPAIKDFAKLVWPALLNAIET